MSLHSSYVDKDCVALPAKMTVFRTLLLVFVLILLNFGNGVEGQRCSSYEALEHKELESGNCEQLVSGKYRTVQCTVRYYQLSRCLSHWCSHIAACLNQTSEWAKLCSTKFYWFAIRSSQFDISAAQEDVNGSYVRNIYVKYCGKSYPTWNTVRFTFSIKTTGFQCQSAKATNVPCSGKWISRDKCDKLINGTNSSWYRIYNSNHWCESFETCLNSKKLKDRCLADFRFYFWYHPAFTFDVNSYVSNTRIQVHYPCSYPYSFSVNVIRCDSAVRNKGSGVDSQDSNGEDFEEEEEDYDLNTEIINSLSELDIQRNDSIQEAVKVFDAKIEEYINRTSVSGTNLTKTRQEKMADILMATVAFEEFALRFGQLHLTHTLPRVNLTSKTIDLQIRRGFDENETEFRVEQKGQNYIRIPSKDFHNGSMLLGVMYKDLHELFPVSKTESDMTNKTSLILNTVIMSATIHPQPTTLQENVTLMFTNVKEATRRRECVFWNFVESAPIGWSGQGCYVKSMDDSKTECSCNHLTHFGVLMQFGTNTEGTKDSILSEADENILTILTKVGLVLSLIGITLTIICYVFLTDIKAPLSQIRVSLVASLGAGQIIFLAGIGATENKGACVTVAAFVQYFLMAAFSWMLIEGIYLYLFVVKVYNVSNKLKICHGVSWGFPAVMVAITLSVAAGKDGIDSFVSKKYCWMSSSNSLLWIFVSFIVVVELLNVLILVRVIKEMTAMEQVKNNQTKQIRLGIKACVVLIPLLGVTWLFGLLSSTHKAFVYIFTIINSTQGFFIFLLHCVRNTEIRERLKRRIHAILPAARDEASTIKRSSELNENSGNVSLKKIKIMPIGMNNKSTESLVKAS